MFRLAIVLPALLAVAVSGAEPDWKSVEPEILRHFQALIRLDTSDPPGNEAPAVAYLKKVLEAEGIAVKTFALEAKRPNLVARLKGSGAKKPLLIMAHTDTVNVDRSKWKDHGPFSADLAGGYIYGRGTVDDKDNLAAGLVTMLLLKRLNTPLDRDVIFLAESGEEGSVKYGIDFMVKNHWAEIESEFCIAEGGGVTRRGGKIHRMNSATTEKNPRAVILTARGTAGHGSVPRPDNAVSRLAQAVARVSAWQTPMRLNDTTRAYFERLAGISPAEDAARYLNIAHPEKSAAIQEHLRMHEPSHYSMLRTSVVPTMLKAGIRKNVIPSEAEATLDVRVAPGEDLDALLDEMRRVVNDPGVEVRAVASTRPLAPPSVIDTEMFRAIEAAAKAEYEGVAVLPTMSTGASDKVYLQQRGVQTYGIGPLTDEEDGKLGFGAHSDQERILESELYRFTRFNWRVTTAVAARK